MPNIGDGCIKNVYTHYFYVLENNWVRDVDLFNYTGASTYYICNYYPTINKCIKRMRNFFLDEDTRTGQGSFMQLLTVYPINAMTTTIINKYQPRIYSSIDGGTIEKSVSPWGMIWV